MDGLNLGEANKVLTKSEYALYFASVHPDFKKITEKNLKSKLERTGKILEKLKTQKMTTKRINKKENLATDAVQKQKKKMGYLLQAQKNFKALIKETRKTESPKKIIKSKDKINPRLIKEAKAFSVTSKQKVQDQNIKSNAKQSKFVKSAFERKLAHSSSRNRRNQGRKDSR